MTKTDISIACERPKISAPVMKTEKKPSASGSAAAASEPNTASRITQDDREARRLGLRQVLLGEVLHRRPTAPPGRRGAC